MQGTERCTVAENEMVRLDGNAVFLSAYNRNATIAKNDVSWNGDTAFAAWGITGKCINEKCDKKLDWPVGPDGRNGEQPRGTQVLGNMVRELGIWQKQSSMWFQAVTAQTHLAGNVHFNGPRAGLNFVSVDTFSICVLLLLLLLLHCYCCCLANEKVSPFRTMVSAGRT
jgi:hypothetical protein